MIEFVDNLSQITTTFLSGCVAGLLYYRSRHQAYFLLTCFYGCFSLAGLYWMLYTLLILDSPPVFYVSDTAWLSSYLFLCLLQHALSAPSERAFRCRAMWLSPLVGIPLLLYYCSTGDIIYNILTLSALMLLAWRAIRSLCWLRQQKDGGRGKRYFQLAILLFVGMENFLWLSSYPWISDTLSNPYFWFDFLLTACSFLLLPATKKAVES